MKLSQEEQKYLVSIIIPTIQNNQSFDIITDEIPKAGLLTETYCNFFENYVIKCTTKQNYQLWQDIPSPFQLLPLYVIGENVSIPKSKKLDSNRIQADSFSIVCIQKKIETIQEIQVKTNQHDRRLWAKWALDYCKTYNIDGIELLKLSAVRDISSRNVGYLDSNIPVMIDY